MSLEATIAENTAAIRQLIAALANQPLPLQATGALAYAQAKAVEVEPVAEVAPAKKPVGSPPATPSPTKPVADSTAATASPSEPQLTYDDIKVPFLTKLVAQKGREAGAALLRHFGVPDGGKLSDIPSPRWAEVLKSINAAVGA